MSVWIQQNMVYENQFLANYTGILFKIYDLDGSIINMLLHTFEIMYEHLVVVCPADLNCDI